MFYDSDIIIVPHGAHMANTLCMRAGSLIVEMACSDFGWTSRADKSYIEPMGLKYVALHMGSSSHPGTCQDQGNSMYANFKVKYDVIKNLILKHYEQY